MGDATPSREREAEEDEEEEERGGSKIYGVTNYHLDEPSFPSFYKISPLSLRYLDQSLQLHIYGALSSFDLGTKRAGEI